MDAHRFADRYRIPSARRPGWSYDHAGLYFVTWCVAGRCPVLAVRGGQGITQTPLGRLVATEIDGVCAHPRGVALDTFVVMPDHVHVLVRLDRMGPSVADVVGQIKGRATRHAREVGLWHEGRLWQTRFHDRIVRDAREHAAVRRYIALNPVRLPRP